MSAWSGVGFNGNLHETGARWQLLGNGRRAYNPVLMRFHSPDRLSPFGRGGINAYAYCAGDPINHADPSGRFALPLLMMGLGVAGAMGGAALAAPGNADQGGKGDTMAWVVGGLVAAASLVVGAGMMKGSWAKMAARPKSGAAPAQPAGSSVAVQASPAKAVNRTKTAGGISRVPRPPSGHKPTPPGRIWHDKKGEPNVHMSELDEYVRGRVVEIRQFAPRGLTPDNTIVPKAVLFKDPAGAFPGDTSGTYFHKYPVFFGMGHGYESWRLIAGGTSQGGFHNFRLTWDHYGSYVKIADWGTYRP